MMTLRLLKTGISECIHAIILQSRQLAYTEQTLQNKQTIN